MMQKCWIKDYGSWEVCNEANRANYKNKLDVNSALTHAYHQQLYLGPGSSLKPFSDPRLTDYWTYKPLAEQLMLPVTADGVNVLTNGTRTLWVSSNPCLCMQHCCMFANPICWPECNMTHLLSGTCTRCARLCCTFVLLPYFRAL